MNSNVSVIDNFYNAFARLDADAMARCYHPEIVFSDPVFGTLKGDQAAKMWRMLIERSGGKLAIRHFNVDADERNGSADWVANYTFSATGRKVENRIHARFGFSDGLIIRHDDRFNFWKWSRQAFGLSGLLLGWTSFMKKKVAVQARLSLSRYREANVSN
jgi:ketosteroid isomerase-like protein